MNTLLLLYILRAAFLLVALVLSGAWFESVAHKMKDTSPTLFAASFMWGCFFFLGCFA